VKVSTLTTPKKKIQSVFLHPKSTLKANVLLLLLGRLERTTSVSLYNTTAAHESISRSNMIVTCIYNG
jgi:hypothetical protein